MNALVQKKTSSVKFTKNLTIYDILGSKSDALLKTFSKIWFFSKVLIGELFFFQIFHQLMAFAEALNCKNWRFHGVKWSESVFWKQNFHQNLFLYKSIPLQNLMRCKIIFPDISHVLKCSIRKFSSFEKLSLSLMRLKFLIQNTTRCIKTDSKAD